MTDAPKIMVLTLPEVMDLKAATPLAQRLIDFQGRPLMLDASRVKHLGGLCLQVLLSARLSWSVDRLALSIKDPSTAFSEALELFGAPRFAISTTS
jgi:chemotaxis protein CheX